MSLVKFYLLLILPLVGLKFLLSILDSVFVTLAISTIVAITIYLTTAYLVSTKSITKII